MDIIPFEPTDEYRDFIGKAFNFPLKLKAINNPGDYDNENIVFVATEEISCLYDFLFMYSVEDEKSGLPAYNKCRYLTFDDIELQEGDLLQINTRIGEDKTSFDSEASVFCNVVYWGLSDPIWHVPHSSFEIMKRSDSYSDGPSLE